MRIFFRAVSMFFRIRMHCESRARMLQKCLLGFCVLIVASGCSTTPKPPHDARAVDFGSIVIGSTSRARVVESLGPPSAMFEQGDVLTYRVAYHPRYTSRYVVPRRAHAGWGGVRYSLVLSFDPAGVLEKCSFAEVKDE